MISTTFFQPLWFCRSRRWYRFSSYQVPWQLLERQWEIMVWSSARRKIYLHIDLSRCISLYFLSSSIALNILSVYQLFHDSENFMFLFGRFQFLARTCFLEVIYPWCNPGTIIINWNMRNISPHSWCLFCMVFFSGWSFILSKMQHPLLKWSIL